MSELVQNPLFGIFLTVATFWVGVILKKWTKDNPLVNPLLISMVLIGVTLTLFQIPLESYRQGGNVIHLFLAPATTVLAVSIYRQRRVLRDNFLPVVMGSLVGSLTSIFSVYGLCVLFGIDRQLTASMLPKSVTTAIAVEISAQLGNWCPSPCPRFCARGSSAAYARLFL